MNSVSERAYEKITTEDLNEFGRAALSKLNAAFERGPVVGLYRDRILLLALAQGGAKHYIDGTNGLKDVDVWAFFAAGPPKPFPPRVRWCHDLGPSKFGKHPDDVGYEGRRIDILGRSIAVSDGEPPETSVRRWLSGGSTSAYHLRQKPMACVYPADLTGRRLA